MLCYLLPGTTLPVWFGTTALCCGAGGTGAAWWFIAILK